MDPQTQSPARQRYSTEESQHGSALKEFQPDGSKQEACGLQCGCDNIIPAFKEHNDGFVRRSQTEAIFDMSTLRSALPRMLSVSASRGELKGVGPGPFQQIKLGI
ncbi:hypothetical protein N7499_004102 [Penicillium canescens]|uniref:Uncharacterized protein n=1 Tax=Penicillium canescens TaxID=5083 RepID=A0AAD6I8F2_PENCN|nr:uncharacterized protein N7446_012197 [Penicillium canescens]KAJ6019984.1 hypothetical protein N7522_000059 [Penicillium canescens]KAJ6037916.1 hypothetical protein N7460_007687 [Penicillium canescens]KAJ6045333.1 hypothetical protein N7446_012197 [Penicillium canescens]KAJ6061032.1 hypothetical protein N7444_001728 [Penicillium canescens]KAJ6088851.1 hypothetical protein N7499_004102 [Penicillium canescens]